MAYFTPTQQWYFDPMRLSQSNIGMMAPQMPAPPTPVQSPRSPVIPPQQPPMLAQEESPVARGIMSGMGAARQSIDIDQAQHDRLMGLVFSREFGGMGSNKGGSVLGGLNEGLGAGIQDYAVNADRMQKLNLLEMERQDALARELQRQQEREQERRDLQAHRAATIGLAREKLGQKTGMGASIEGFNLSNLPDLDKSTRSKYSVDYRGTGKLLSEIETIKAGIRKLKETEEERGSPLVSQANPYIGGAVNPIKDIYGRTIPGTKLGSQLNKERLERQSVNSKLQQFRARAEKDLKGGQLTKGIYKRFEQMKTFPDLSQGYDTVGQLLNDIEKEALEIHKSADMSLRSGKQITPYELGDIEMLDKVNKAKEQGWTQEEIDRILQE